jgi:YD repeat-containing protein
MVMRLSRVVGLGSFVLVAAAGVFLGASGWLAHYKTDHVWYWSQAGCRYAEIDDAFTRQSVARIAGFLWDPQSCAAAYYEQGNFYWSQGKWKEAMQQYGYGLRLSPDDPKLRTRHGGAAMASDRFEAAMQDYDVLLRLDPSNLDAMTRRGMARETLGDWQGAIADFSEVIRRDPDNDDALTYRGRAFTLLGRTREGIADLTASLDVAPGDLSTNLWLYLAQRRIGESAKEGLRARVENLDLKPWPGAAIAYFLGELPADTLERIGFDDPNNRVWRQECDAWFYLGEEALAQGDKQKARQLFRETTTQCDSVDFEWDAAQLELKHLGQ